MGGASRLQGPRPPFKQFLKWLIFGKVTQVIFGQNHLNFWLSAGNSIIIRAKTVYDPQNDNWSRINLCLYIAIVHS